MFMTCLSNVASVVELLPGYLKVILYYIHLFLFISFIYFNKNIIITIIIET